MGGSLALAAAPAPCYPPAMLNRPENAVSIGLDFGTTNTVVALAQPNGGVETIRFAHPSMPGPVFMTALMFWEERIRGALTSRVEAGPWAIQTFLEGGHPHRFIQSFKTFAASPVFKDTRIFRARLQFEDLLAVFLRTLARHAGPALDYTGAALAVGRPVLFAGSNPDEGLAMRRYRSAFGLIGASHARYVYEPVGAAFSFARRLNDDATVLVADLGGGTSDFSVLRFERQGGKLGAAALGHAGIGIAGDVFDQRLIDQIVAPRLGKHATYRSFGKVLPVPAHYFANLARWNHLALMKGSGDLKELRDLARAALEPSGLHDFIRLVEEDLGFALYRAISDLKIALSRQPEAEFHFADRDLVINAPVTRADFESWILEDVARIAGAMEKALDRASLGAAAIDSVFLTGGSALVPAIRRLFADRFGEEKLYEADHFDSIASGLALIGQSAEADAWSFA